MVSHSPHGVFVFFLFFSKHCWKSRTTRVARSYIGNPEVVEALGFLAITPRFGDITWMKEILPS